MLAGCHPRGTHTRDIPPWPVQSARSSSVSNVRAELARLLPGLSPFTALAEPPQQGSAGPQGLAAHQQGFAAGQHPLVAAQQALAAQQQGLAAGPQGLAAGQHPAGHPVAVGGDIAADALAAAATYASNRVGARTTLQKFQSLYLQERCMYCRLHSQCASGYLYSEACVGMWRMSTLYALRSHSLETVEHRSAQLLLRL